MDIRPLRVIDLASLNAIASGYVSTERLEVRVVGQPPDAVRFELDRVRVDPAYVRGDAHTAGDVARLNVAIAQGQSLGVWDGVALVAIAVAERMDWNRTLVLHEFHVAAARRRRGVGTALMQAVIRSAGAWDVRAISVETQNTNLPAIRFYLSCGFSLHGVDVSLYDEPVAHEVALYMRRPL